MKEGAGGGWVVTREGWKEGGLEGGKVGENEAGLEGMRDRDREGVE